MTGIIGAVINGMWQNAVQRCRKHTYANTQQCGDPHRNPHADGRFSVGKQLFVIGGAMREESKIRNFDAGMFKHASRCKQQHQIGPHNAAIAQRRHCQRLGNKATEQRKGRDRHRADDTTHHGKGHVTVQPAKRRGLDRTDSVQDRPHAHKQQCLVDDMDKCVRHRPVDRQRCADANSHNHETQLVVQTEGKHAAQIIFNHRKEYRQYSHRRTNPDQHVGAREPAGKGVDSQLGGKG